ncbi:MAG: hypothetical protein PHZ26_03900 [Candidatus Gracilibacteria bacterium]|nr:hypothetical protein [Candidatus Gracilibacteria bacterium]MDD2908871.1 hypothetical protein [Candidatus Gracilibacteria bacterium]
MNKAVSTQNAYYEKLNKPDAVVYNDYLTLLEKGLLLNLKLSDLDNLEISYMNGNNEETISNSHIKKELFKSLNVVEKNFETEKEAQRKLLEKVYSILRNIMNHPAYPNSDINTVTEETLKASFKELHIKTKVDNKLVAIFVELNKISKVLTRLDMMSIEGKNEDDLREELEKIIYNELGIDKKSPNAKTIALENINKLYSRSIFKMRNNFGLKIPKEYKTKGKEVFQYDKEWKSIDEFIDFMLTTSYKNKQGKQVEGYTRLVNCAITKTMVAYNEIMENKDMVDSLYNVVKDIINKLEKIPGAGHSFKKNGDIIYYFNSRDGSEEHFKCRIAYRTKASAKILQKLLYNRKYTSFDFLKDLIGFRIEVYDAVNGKAAVEFLVKHLFEGNVMCDNKGFFEKEIMDEIVKSQGIEQRGKGQKNTTSNDFVNLSLYGNVKGLKKVEGLDKIPPVEIQLVYTGNQNESGMNKHEIYDSKKLMSVVSRLFGYITLEHIKVIIHEVGLKSLEEEKHILEHLFLNSNENGKVNKSYIYKLDTQDEEIKSAGKKNNFNNYIFISKDVFSEQFNDLYGKEIKVSEIGKDEFAELFKIYSSIKI